MDLEICGGSWVDLGTCGGGSCVDLEIWGGSWVDLEIWVPVGGGSWVDLVGILKFGVDLGWILNRAGVDLGWILKLRGGS